MVYIEFFGVRRYSCDHRAHHPAIYVNLYTGEHVSDDSLPCQEQTTRETP